MKSKRQVAIAVLAATCCTAFAGPVTEVTLTGQPLQYTKEGAIDGCGIRLVGMPTPVPGQQQVPVLDVSFNVVNPGGGLVKGGLMNLPVKALRAGDLRSTVEVPIKNVWLKAPGGIATRPANGKPMATSTHKHGLMYATGLEPVLALIAAMQEEQPIQVGFDVTSKDMEMVFFGKVQLTDAETAQFSQCFLEWSDALDRRLRESAGGEPRKN